VDQRARGQQVASVPIHSLRRPGVVARQETILSGAGESLTIVHDTVEPALAYAPGIRLALGAARDARGVVVGLDSLIDIGIGRHHARHHEPVVQEGAVPGQVARVTGA
jgi:4-hydroxy-tetrahydrodipicolinate reductase